jgi:hypothetical protein
MAAQPPSMLSTVAATLWPGWRVRQFGTTVTAEAMAPAVRQRGDRSRGSRGRCSEAQLVGWGRHKECRALETGGTRGELATAFSIRFVEMRDKVGIGLVRFSLVGPVMDSKAGQKPWWSGR